MATASALGFITVVGISRANPETLKAQPFLLDGSNGVRNRKNIDFLPELVKIFKYLAFNLINVCTFAKAVVLLPPVFCAIIAPREISS